MSRLPWQLARGLVVTAAFASAAAGEKARLRTATGAAVLVEASTRTFGVGGLVPGAASALRYEVRDAGGRVFTGLVTARGEGVAGRDPMLAEDPISGDVYLVFALLRERGSDLALARWTGQGWSDAETIVEDVADDRDPALAFREDGSALLAWRRTGAAEQLLLQHVELDASGGLRTLAFADLGDPGARLRPAGGDVRLPAGLACVLAGQGDQVHVVLADPDDDEVAILTLALAGGGGGSGIGASPVPVTFARMAPHSAPEPDSGLPRGTSASLDGQQPDPWRMELGSVEAYYWQDDALHVVAFRGEDLAFARERPACSEDEAHVAVAGMLRRLVGEGGGHRRLGGTLGTAATRR